MGRYRRNLALESTLAHGAVALTEHRLKRGSPCALGIAPDAASWSSSGGGGPFMGWCMARLGQCHLCH